MRNIEEIAEEEEARVQEARKDLFRKLFWATGMGLSFWGWMLFKDDQTGKGALIILLSFVLLGLSWGGAAVLRVSALPALAGLMAAVLSFWLFNWSGLPSFYWGKDPAFWLSVHAGAVVEPPWFPLASLLGQAACFLFPWNKFTLLPALSGAALSLGLFFILQYFCGSLKNKSTLNCFLSLFFCLGLAVCLPFWNAATIGFGLVASLGLLLFLFQRLLLEREERPWKVLFFLVGLLFCVHPLWGLLGLVSHLGTMDQAGRRLLKNLIPFLSGWTPALWIWFRADKVFPSWGGAHPFVELLRGKKIVPADVVGAFEPLASLKTFGWMSAAIVGLALLLVFLNLFKWKSINKSVLAPFDFWIGILALIGGVLFYDASSRSLGPTSLWFLVAATGLLLRLLERGTEKRQVLFLSGNVLLASIGVALLTAVLGAWFSGEHCVRNKFLLPQQHAFNLLQALPDKRMEDPGNAVSTHSLLVCRDSFEAMACLEARLIHPFKMDSVIIQEKFLNRKWMALQCIDRAPELLFSSVIGQPLGVLKSLVKDNRDRWEIHWALSKIPVDWTDPPVSPAVLTLQFDGPAASSEPEKAQYHYDLTPLHPESIGLDGLSAICLSRYTAGFTELGKRLMEEKKYSAAIQVFERAVKLDASFEEPRNRLAEMYSQQKILEAARLEFEKILKTHPDRIAKQMRVLETAQKGAEDSRIVGLLDEMIGLNSELADAQYQLYKIYEKQGRLEEAKELLEASVKLNPKRIETQMSLGRQMSKLGYRIKAEEAFRTVLMIDPENKEAQVEMWKLLNKP